MLAASCPYPATVRLTWCIMAIALRILDSADLARSKANAHPEVQQDILCEEGKKVQYRQLVSRAVTQRLHSSSLEDLTKTTVDTTPAHTLEEWELQERCIARNKARVETEMLGIPWSTIRSPSLLHTLLPSYRVFYACTRTDSQKPSLSTMSRVLLCKSTSSDPLATKNHREARTRIKTRVKPTVVCYTSLVTLKSQSGIEDGR
jgi:hypothetical protein